MSKKICLDAGHVGSKYNQSPVVKTYYESAMVWALHLKLKAQLEARGFQVVTTRASIDTDLGVYERGTASKGCDVFISLHSNACGTESVDYPVVYRAYDNKNNVDTLALKLAKKVGELMGTTQAGRTATRKNSSGGEYYGVLRGARAVGTPYYLSLIHIFDQEGRKICEAVSAELLAFGPHCAQAALERHLRDQKRQEKEMREILDSMTRPYELRVQEGGRPSEAVGMIDLTIKADRPSKVVTLPNDKEFRAEMAANRKTGKKASGDEFLGKKADDALARLRAMNE